MAITIAETVRRFKADVAQCLQPAVIEQLCRVLGHTWRERALDPVTTVHTFLLQVLHGNVACSALPHLTGRQFTDSAYCEARARLPLDLFSGLLQQVCAALEHTIADSGRWRGHRTWGLDGSSFSMPDMPELQAQFGQSSHQAAGCGFPVAHLLVLFHAQTGLLLRIIAAAMRTHDLTQAAHTHDALAAGDILVADRGFVSYAHLALLFQRKIHAVFRAHQTQIIDFHPRRQHTSARRPIKGRPRSRWLRRLGKGDQLVEYFKPPTPPPWLSAEAYAALPDSIRVRELRYTIRQRSCRTRQVTLVTTLLDPVAYPAAALAELYGQRWQVETNLRHLKQTMGLAVLRCKTVAGVLKELHMFALAYNLVRLVMLEAAERQQVMVERISFVDALRWLCSAEPGSPLATLVVNPWRPNRYEPRVRKRRPRHFPWMQQPRPLLRKALLRKKDAA
jgi:DDE family transposase